ncbi:putative RNA-binding protein [Trypanosoma rangeli]|uniref:Putative RNA-binding protein n=1 Tax=Trypanosoma rangeli TaxID=5698 RepID=A0A3R7NWC3_TRYRA|nr:putative RNA-binding protein [Trypanosoma rangeli]RNF08743.1 putative RNA-binding protein [Trypanosoma rangeli]|eukprot:RNF08743.1 putative RNA-binding protein [Trypanosoma rangeli]
MLEAGASPVRPVSPVSSASTAEFTAGHDISTFNRTLDASSIHDDGHLVEGGSKHWIRVTHLDPTTTSKSLEYMFYPHGGDEAFVLWENGVVGYVGFENKYMADLGVEKMDAFIPCRQTQALRVTRVSLEEVSIARNVACFSSQKGLTPMLYSDCPVQFIAKYIEMHRQPSYCAAELVKEVARAPRSVFARVLAVLTELKSSWISLEEFRETLARQLLQNILKEDSTDVGANCGTLLGELYVMGLLTGDPFFLASRLLQCGVQSIHQVDSICSIAHACAPMPFPISKASFWALVGHVTQEAADHLRTALRGHLRQFKQSMELLSPRTFVAPKNSWLLTNEHNSNSNNASRLLSESKSRTLYMSHLPPMLPQQTLMELLSVCGAVNKIRICRGSGYTTLFAFVEMATAEEARAALRLNRTSLLGCSIRVQIARNSIQDTQTEDAVIDADGAPKRGCLFGQHGGALAAAVEAGEKVVGA